MVLHRKLPKLDLNLTNACNFNCVHCAFRSGELDLGELSLSEIEKILIETKELGGEKIDLTGGECTLRQDLGEIISLAKSLDYKIELVTNGSLLTRDKIIEFQQRGLDSIAISLDGSDYSTYHRIRKVPLSVYQTVLKTIDNCLELGLKTKINTVVFESNLEDIPNITRWCAERGVYEHGIYYFTPIGRGSNSHELSADPFAWLDLIRERLSLYADQLKISIEVPLIEKEKNLGEDSCLLSSDPFHLQILSDGNVYPCAILASYGLPIGNLHRESVVEIWNDEKRWKNYADKISSSVFSQCRGHCFDLPYTYDTEKYSPVCPLRKFLPEALN